MRQPGPTLRWDWLSRVQAFSQHFNIENRLDRVTDSVTGIETAFYYDADTVLTKKVITNGQAVTPTIYAGGLYEVERVGTGTPKITRYYMLGGKRVAMRVSGSSVPAENATTYLHGDHLGSASLATSDAGAVVSALRYTPYGAPRDGSLPTDRRYTGQREEAGIGLYDYNARFYDPALGRFISPDTIVPEPGNAQAFNRYAYTLNNPMKYTDPSGHYIESPLDLAFIAFDIAMIAMDVGAMWTAGGPTDETTLHLVVDTAALAADIACLSLPRATGGGVAVRVAVGIAAMPAAYQATRVGLLAAQTGMHMANLGDGIEFPEPSQSQVTSRGNNEDLINAANKAADDAMKLPRRLRPAKVAAVETVEGKIGIYMGSSGDNVFKNAPFSIQELLNAVPENQRAPYHHGKCAEIDASSNVIKDGASLWGAKITVRDVVPSTSLRYHVPVEPCPSCRFSVINHYGMKVIVE